MPRVSKQLYHKSRDNFHLAAEQRTFIGADSMTSAESGGSARLVRQLAD